MLLRPVGVTFFNVAALLKNKSLTCLEKLRVRFPDLNTQLVTGWPVVENPSANWLYSDFSIFTVGAGNEIGLAHFNPKVVALFWRCWNLMCSRIVTDHGLGRETRSELQKPHKVPVNSWGWTLQVQDFPRMSQKWWNLFFFFIKAGWATFS